MKAGFDLIYVTGPDARTMSCVVIDSSGDHMIGPFPSKEAFPNMAAAADHYAASEMDETALNTEKGGKAVDGLNAWLDRQIGEEVE